MVDVASGSRGRARPSPRRPARRSCPLSRASFETKCSGTQTQSAIGSSWWWISSRQEVCEVVLVDARPRGGRCRSARRPSRACSSSLYCVVLVEADRERPHRLVHQLATSARRSSTSRRRRRGRRRTGRRTSSACRSTRAAGRSSRSSQLGLRQRRDLRARRRATSGSSSVSASIAPSARTIIRSAGRELADALEHRQRGRRADERQVVVERLLVELRRERRVREQRLDLGGEHEARRAAARSRAALCRARSRARNSSPPARVPDREARTSRRSRSTQRGPSSS